MANAEQGEQHPVQLSESDQAEVAKLMANHSGWTQDVALWELRLARMREELAEKVSGYIPERQSVVERANPNLR